jgi:hypothetical protein
MSSFALEVIKEQVEGLLPRSDSSSRVFVQKCPCTHFFRDPLSSYEKDEEEKGLRTEVK